MTLQIAIIDNDTLQAMGLKSLITEIIPIAEVYVFQSFSMLEEEGQDNFIHYFVTAQTLLENNQFFQKNRHKTMVLTTQNADSPIFANFHVLNICQPERKLIKDILKLYETGHGHGGVNVPNIDMKSMKQDGLQKIQSHPHAQEHIQSIRESALSPRETEVLSLVVKGNINKEIADKLNISLPTVVSHRKNINEKLNMKSVSALTIYAVMHGIVSIDEI